MLVKCPGCLTTYRVSEQQVTSNKPAFRCSRCKLIFALELKPKDDLQSQNESAADRIQTSIDGEPDLPFNASKGLDDPSQFAGSTTRQETQAREPSITTSLEHLRREPEEPSLSEFTAPSVAGSTDFTPAEERETQIYSPPQTSEEPPLPEPETFPGKNENYQEPPPPQSLGMEDAKEPAWVKSKSSLTQGANNVLSPLDTQPEPPGGDEGDTEETSDDFAAAQDRRDAESGGHPLLDGGPLSVVPYVSLFGLLLLAFSLLTLMHQTQPERLEAYIRPVPWVGSQLLKNNHLGQGVIVGSLHTGYQRILGNREVFVISGKIYNRNSVSVGEVRVEGLIHDATGAEIASQVISVGNPISSKIIRDMTVREIAILQRLRPQKKFEVEPEGSAAFTIVFLKPTKEIESFSCRVLFAQDAA